MWTHLFVLASSNPHSMECLQGRENRTANPYGVHTFWRCDNLHVDAFWNLFFYFLGESFFDTREHSRATRKHYIAIEVSSEVYVAFRDGANNYVIQRFEFCVFN